MTGNWDTDFIEFQHSDAVEPPPALSAAVLAKAQSLLNPPAWLVFIKLTVIGLASGWLSLLVCPQLDIGFGRHFVLMHIFAAFGPRVCEFACGIFFGAASVLLAGMLFRLEELQVLFKTRFLQLASLTLISLGLFVCAGADVFLQALLVWLIAAFSGSLTAVHLTYKLRRALHAANRCQDSV